MTEQKFDVFLCHNSEDKPAVIQIAQQLRQNNLTPWLDVWEICPGEVWQLVLERQIESIGAAAVFIGKQGIGPWQQQEIYCFLQEFVSRQLPVIPVMLDDAPQQPKLPVLLKNLHWVDFRLQEPDPLEQLIWGITKQKLGETNSQEDNFKEKEVLFSTLERLLRHGIWEEADAETARIMILFSGDESETEFVHSNISKFP
ncbi:MAG TPA: TIR domain-containing protein, partial [Nodosilinea sp.]|nr:TIR domain-containing protein [Nodosilinea sp.]